LITCGPGLRDPLAAEVEGMGFEVVDGSSGGVVTRGSIFDCMRLNFTLRTAYNVLFLMKEFRCGSDTSLYKQVSNLPWENVIGPSGYLCVLSKVDTWTIDNSMYPNLKVKDAIVDRISGKTGGRPDSGPERHGVVVNLFWKKDKAWIYLNTSGVKLSDRNYRKMPHTAPLRESLAAGLLMASGFDGTQDIVLPMCGSGTLAIEAAMIAQNKPAGLLRTHFGFMALKGYDEQKWKTLRREIVQAAGNGWETGRIIATDRDPKAIEAARQNAKTAGVDGFIEFGVCDFAETEIPPGSGIVLMNPEYGLRLGETGQLEKEYKRMGDFLKQKCAGYTGYIFTGNPGLAKKVGLKASRRMEFFNGNINCRLLKYELYQGTRL